MPKVEATLITDVPAKQVYDIICDYMHLHVWNIVVNGVEQVEKDKFDKKFLFDTNVGPVLNTVIEEVSPTISTSIQEDSAMEKIGYIVTSMDDGKTNVKLWAEFELEDNRFVLEMAAELFLKSLKVFLDYIQAGGNPEEYEKVLEKIESAEI
ncbi:MAG: SRPBCC family protein [Candidatus Hodarchaeota archaeon]